jgi:DNA-binding NarL/FixJ family response regulator
MRQHQDLSRIRAALDLQRRLTVVGTGADSYQAIKLVESQQPDVAIIDYQLDYGGLDVITLVKSRSPGTSIILMSSCNDGKHALDALRKGVSGYLLKKTDMDTLVNVVYTVRAGDYYISRRIMVQIFQALAKVPGSDAVGGKLVGVEEGFPRGMLNRKEMKILGYLREGKNTKEIGERLGLKIGTVRNYISGLMRKNGVRSRVEMAYFVRGRWGEEWRGGSGRSRRAEGLMPLLEASLNVED